jgi:hypothetical protein
MDGYSAAGQRPIVITLFPFCTSLSQIYLICPIGRVVRPPYHLEIGNRGWE